MAVAFGQLGHAVTLPVAWTGEAERLAAGFGRQLGTKKRTDAVQSNSCR